MVSSQDWMSGVGVSATALRAIPGGRHEVWQVDTETGSYILKRLASAERFEAEHTALMSVAGLAGTPALIAASPEARLLLQGVVPGKRPQRMKGHMLVAAGAFLKYLHARPVTASGPASPERLLRRASRAAHRVGERVDAEILRQILSRVEDHADRVGPRVRVHGDFCARNWLWDARAGLGVIDWELSHEGSAFQDFARLGQGLRDPDFRGVFFYNYGRQIDREEELLLDGLYGVEVLLGLGKVLEEDRQRLVRPLLDMLQRWR